MTGRQKILKVLKHVKKESEINPNPKWVEFKFNTNVMGAGILTDDQEKRILMKLENEGVIKIHLPDAKDDMDESYLSTFTPTEYMMESNSIWIEILPAFRNKYFLYNLIAFDSNAWNFINPFWLIWKFCEVIIFLLKWLWQKSKALFIFFGGLGSFLAVDYSLAWKNVKILSHLFKIL